MPDPTVRPALVRIPRGFRAALRGAQALALGSLLVACGEGAPGPEAAPSPAPETQAATAPDGPGVPPAETQQPPADGPYTRAADLPPARELEVTVEGQTELRAATLFESPQAYAIYVLPQLVMTPEEPCCDMAYARVDGDFFMRIERIDPGLDPATLRENMALALSAVGEPEPLPADQVPLPGARDIELAGRARGDGVSMTMLIARIDGGRYRVTLHLPHREPAEGIGPSLWAMLASLRTTGPRPQP